MTALHAHTAAIRHMPVDESTVWIATARDIGHLDTYHAAEWSR